MYVLENCVGAKRVDNNFYVVYVVFILLHTVVQGQTSLQSSFV
jgi:hypothetical protein